MLPEDGFFVLVTRDRGPLRCVKIRASVKHL